MSASDEEVRITQRVAERPGLELGRMLEVRRRDLGIRFVAGGLTSVVSGVLTTAVSARVGGIFLAFPAILAASLTLIAQQENSTEAREDARGAVMGGCAMAVFAAVAALTFGSLPGGVVLALATLA
jgi:hypothetical protein